MAVRKAKAEKKAAPKGYAIAVAALERIYRPALFPKHPPDCEGCLWCSDEARRDREIATEQLTPARERFLTLLAHLRDSEGVPPLILVLEAFTAGVEVGSSHYDMVGAVERAKRSQRAKRPRLNRRKFSDSELLAAIAQSRAPSASGQAYEASGTLKVSTKAVEKRMKLLGLWRPKRKGKA